MSEYKERFYTEVVPEDSSEEDEDVHEEGVPKEPPFQETASGLRKIFKLGYFALVERFRLSQGDFGSVDFSDIAQAIEEREERHGDILGFFHTHPPDACYISETDIGTARAYSESFGKRIIMLIEVGVWLGAWIVDSEKRQKQIKAFRIPFVHGMYLVFMA